MRCPDCGGDDHKVTRTTTLTDVTVRTLTCKKCGYKFLSKETVDLLHIKPYVAEPPLKP